MYLLPAFVGAPMVNRVYCMDALDLLGAMLAGSVDAVITDPPYGIGYSSHHARIASKSFGIDRLDTSWLKDAFRVLKTDSVLYLCTRWDVAETWKQAAEDAGFDVKQRIVWDKGNWTGGDLEYYASQTEDILFAVKGNPCLKLVNRPSNIWRINRAVRYQSRAVVNSAAQDFEDHPTMKPVKLMERMIEDSTDMGSLILDPFCGSGTTGIAARNTGRNFIMGDITLEYVEVARKRLAQPYTLPMFETLEAAAD